jgi:uncharacterized protein (DUF488 family)
MAHPLFTIGHGDRDLDTFLGMLRDANILALADVRRFPGSRRHPHFGRDALASALAAAGIEYRWAGEALGGRRKPQRASRHLALRSDAFRAYADHMDTPEFRASLDALLTRSAGDLTAILCAERHPSNCHRSLISDAVLVRGVPVIHLLEPGKSCAATLHPCARADGDCVVYDVGAQLGFDAEPA